MSPPAVAFIFLLCAIGAALVGTLLRTRLPDEHLAMQSTDVLKLLIGLIATLSALVLGLLIASAQSSYNAQVEAVQKMAANVVQMDRFLILYGPQTAKARELLREGLVDLDRRVWSPDGMNREAISSLSELAPVKGLYRELASLAPRNEAQRFALNNALQLWDEIGVTRLLMYEQSGRTISAPFLVILIFWVCALFFGFGLLAPPNATLAAAYLVGVISVSGAVFLILELNNPYQGFIQLSDTPLREALAQMQALAK